MGIEALQNLTSKDLSDLIFVEVPSNDTLHVTNAVMAFLGEPIGWESFQKAVKGLNFVQSVSNLDYDLISDGALEQVSIWEAQF